MVLSLGFKAISYVHQPTLKGKMFVYIVFQLKFIFDEINISVFI